MALKDIWKRLIDGESEISADDINNIADAVIELEENGSNINVSSKLVLLCDYTHTLDIENWDGSDYGGTFVLDKEVNPDALKLYINGEYVPMTYVYDDVGASYFLIADTEVGDYTFEYSIRNKYINFPPWVTKGNNYKVYEETVHQLADKYIPDSIARTEYVEAKIQESIGEALEGDY